MYTAYPLPQSYHDMLEERIPYAFSEKFGDHITVQFPYNIKREGPIPDIESVIKPYAVLTDGENIECVMVTVDGMPARPDGSFYHITWSIHDRTKTKPIESNNIIHRYFREQDQTVKLTLLSRVQMEQLTTVLKLVVKSG